MRKVLIVDDSAFMRLILKDILKRNGFEVIGEAENGLQAIAKYKDLNPDIVTMDITMPEMDGIETLKKNKRIRSKSNSYHGISFRTRSFC